MKNADNSGSSPGQPVVLIAEDEQLIRNVARVTLENDGYRVLTAEDGEAALELSRAFPRPIDLLLTDILMPRMSGLELALHIRVERPDTQILVISGTHHPGHDLPYLAKPFTPATLRKAIAAILRPPVRTP